MIALVVVLYSLVGLQWCAVASNRFHNLIFHIHIRPPRMNPPVPLSPYPIPPIALCPLFPLILRFGALQGASALLPGTHSTNSSQ